jgi:hypothetical protein
MTDGTLPTAYYTTPTAAQPAPVQPVGRVCFEGDEVVWIDEPPESGSLLYTTPPAQEFICSTGLCHYKPAAAVQEPVASLKEADVLMIAEAHGIDPSTKGLYGFYIDCISQAPAQKAPVQDAEGENMAVRCFLMLYGQRSVTVGQMKKNMAMSGFKFWPAWVDSEPEGAHLTKAGAQLWIRHLFSLEATPPAAQRQWVGLTDNEKIDCASPYDSRLCCVESTEAKLKEKNA